MSNWDIIEIHVTKVCLSKGVLFWLLYLNLSIYLNPSKCSRCYVRISVSGCVSVIIYQVGLSIQSHFPLLFADFGPWARSGQWWLMEIKTQFFVSPRLCAPANPVYLIHQRKSKCHLVAALTRKMGRQEFDTFAFAFVKVSGWNSILEILKNLSLISWPWNSPKRFQESFCKWKTSNFFPRNF